jgi:hypothetical protein
MFELLCLYVPRNRTSLTASSKTAVSVFKPHHSQSYFGILGNGTFSMSSHEGIREEQGRGQLRAPAAKSPGTSPRCPSYMMMSAPPPMLVWRLQTKDKSVIPAGTRTVIRR